jgi:hypothetical protein
MTQAREELLSRTTSSEPRNQSEKPGRGMIDSSISFTDWRFKPPPHDRLASLFCASTKIFLVRRLYKYLPSSPNDRIVFQPRTSSKIKVVNTIASSCMHLSDLSPSCVCLACERKGKVRPLSYGSFPSPCPFLALSHTGTARYGEIQTSKGDGRTILSTPE